MSERNRLVVCTLLVLFGISAASSSFAQTVQRGPYLQMATPTGLVVRWRTDQSVDSVVRYSTTPGSLSQSAVGNTGTEHNVALSGLLPDTRYYYSIGTSAGALAGDLSYTFVTGPPTGVARATRIWVIGDSGEANKGARDVRDAYKDFTGARATDTWLMLGDNAYRDGTDAEYQAAVFDIYPELLRQTPVWSTLGNHDGHSASSASQSGTYYDIFTLPRNGEAGGLASGTEAYYSFDRANIHFVVLDSYDSDRSVNGTMLTWLENDLAATQQDWLIAFWHHPPYTKGSHDSDNEGPLIDMRENALPLLESYGVDLVLTGHSHSYERSYLIDQHYGRSSTFNSSMKVDAGSGREDDTGAYLKGAPGAINQGAVYAVAGSSSKATGGSLDHPAMFLSLNEMGSMVLDIDGLRMDAIFLDDVGNVLDYFTLRIDGGVQPDLEAPSSPANLRTTAVTADSISLLWDAATDNVDVTGYRVSRDGQTIATVGNTSLNDSGLESATTYTYSVLALDAAGNESAAVTINIETNPGPGDSEAPTNPANLRVTTVTSNSISLAWDAASDNVGVTGYRISRGGQFVTTVTDPGFTDSGLQDGTTYAYGVVAIDDAGNRSVEALINATTNAANSVPADSAPADSGGSGAADLIFLLGLAPFLRRRWMRSA